MLAQRVLSALAGGPLLLWGAWVGGWPLFSMMLLLALLAHHEMVGMFRRRDVRILPWAGAVSIALIVGAAQWGGPEYFSGTLILAALLPLIAQLVRPGVFTLADSAFTAMSTLYIGGLVGYLLLLRFLGDGHLLVVALLLTWSYDTAAYFCGRVWGRHKLAPRLSPQKTWEGALGGAGITVALASLFSRFGLLPLPIALGAGAVVTVFAQTGDLIESAIKRYAQVKDSGRLIPGHGGVLDRFDGLLLTGFALYFYFLVVLG